MGDHGLTKINYSQNVGTINLEPMLVSSLQKRFGWRDTRGYYKHVYLAGFGNYVFYVLLDRVLITYVISDPVGI